mmetsp:Transcript_11069/g.14419  ORF Transcript_11069/g.14419 Transcript_11069/m.14419 type:complete len:501 (+) Transcript_11069:167-1669(+)|eukprot:CAMPEP_0204869120 /NCGR_PEP_ID=MMETSP1348-20121228/28666_1 /ASSEMBLY_ACC=CAM_ASM_000700 /TAXON_ID=215587 /ORGANISM="Aplanochytrium stocchinoi, Strain GSBS06" /LENGTH=500 /DNA_ID=CAMNT_0052022349 /DNA_START=100 /DNA_END=1602 /DNA_ORIENTATION=+
MAPKLSAKPDGGSVTVVNPHFGAKETNSKKSARGKRYRASFMTHVLGNLARESDAKCSYVVGLLFFKERLDVEKVKTNVLDKLLDMPRFRSKFVSKHFGAYFEELAIEDLDLDYHVQVAFEDENPTRADILSYLAEKMSQKSILDKSKPLWQMVIIPEMEDGRSCLITNISHIIGDGMSQVEVLYRLIDEEPAKTWEQFEELIADKNESSIEGQDVRAKGKRPKQKVSKFRAAKIFIGGVFGGVFAVFGRPDPKTSLKLKTVTTVSVEKRQALTERIDMEKLKELKSNIEGATINDVLIVLLTICIKKYFDEHDKKKIGKLSASFPINLRARGQDNLDQYGSPHNVWAYGMMPLHLRYKNKIELIWKVKKTLDDAKLSPNPVVQLQLGKMVAPILPLKAMNGVALNVANKATVQLSNVAGPGKAVSIAGYTIDEMAFQLFSPLGLYLGIISYNGQVSCSINADSSLGDPEEIAKHWKVEFDALYDEVMSQGEIRRPRTCF